jgi:ubiquinone/menaquinone biosynthesis C-methylase UbiE
MERIPSRYDFSNLAKNYGSWFQTREGKLFDSYGKKAIKKHLAPGTKGMKLLDVGCGTGHWSSFFAEYGYRVTAIDVSQVMIETAMRKQTGSVTYLAADAHELPFPDKQFDVTAAITTIEFARNPAGAIREMVRCTKKHGGIVLIGVLNFCARTNKIHRNNGIPPYSDAWFFSPQQVYNMLAPYGKPDIRTAVFIPYRKSVLPYAYLLNTLGSAFRLSTGALIVGTVEV